MVLNKNIEEIKNIEILINNIKQKYKSVAFNDV